EPARRRNRVRDGDACLRAGGLRTRPQGSTSLDARRGRSRHRLPQASRGVRRDLQHEESLLARARVPRRRFLRRALGGRILAGAGSRWGAVLGGILYTYLDNRLGAIGDSSTVHGLPGVLNTPLSQPLFLLGAIFILIVIFLPGGLAGIAARGRPRGLGRLEEAI